MAKPLFLLFALALLGCTTKQPSQSETEGHDELDENQFNTTKRFYDFQIKIERNYMSGMPVYVYFINYEHATNNAGQLFFFDQELIKISFNSKFDSSKRRITVSDTSSTSLIKSSLDSIYTSISELIKIPSENISRDSIDVLGGGYDGPVSEITLSLFNQNTIYSIFISDDSFDSTRTKYNKLISYLNTQLLNSESNNKGWKSFDAPN